MSSCTVERRGSVAVLTFGCPPVNSLGFATRRDLAAAFDATVSDASVAAIVLIGRNGTFCAGADIKELGSMDFMKPPVLWNVLDMLDASPKPVVAAIEGVALGGGLELAMACHYRVALQSAKLGLPEVKIGVLPGGGGTQRLPRLIGIENALNVIVGGEPIPAKMFAGTPLLDACVTDNCLAAALALAEAKALQVAKGAVLPRARDRVVKDPNREALLQFARNTVKAKFANFPAPLNCIDAIADLAVIESKVISQSVCSIASSPIAV